jgi:hypothetical protein
MSGRENHTDRLFRESLQKYRQAPPERVWSGISETLYQDRRKARMAWIGRIAASAALVLVAGSIWFVVQRTPDRELGMTDTREAETPETAAEIREKSTEALQQAAEIRESTTGIQPSPAESPVPVSASPETREERPADRQSLLEVREIDMPAGQSTRRTEPVLLASLQPTPSYVIPVKEPGTGSLVGAGAKTAIAPPPDEGIDVFEEFGDGVSPVHDRWAVGGQVTPLYSYRSLEPASGNYTATTANHYDNIENGILSYSGGVNLNYFPSKRLSIQSGIYYSRMGMSVSNTYLASLNDQAYQLEFEAYKMPLSNSSGHIEVGGKSNTVLSSFFPSRVNDPVDGALNNPLKADVKQGDILQHFEYLEIPMILRYRVVDRRLGFNLLGGLSTNFLVGNNVYFEDGGDREYIGTTADIKTVNYSSVLGVGFQYSIRRNFHINMEPTFRYYLNSINTGSGIGSHPYSLGFFTGISYSF